MKAQTPRSRAQVQTQVEQSVRGLNPPSRKEVTKNTVPNLLASPSESTPPLGEPQ